MPSVEESKILYELTVTELKTIIASAIQNENNGFEQKLNQLNNSINNLIGALAALSAKLDKDISEVGPAYDSPIAFTLYENTHEKYTWYDLVLTFYEEMYKDNKGKFQKVLKLKEFRKWFSDNPKKLAPSSKPQEICNSGIWGKTHIGEVHFRLVVDKFRRHFGYDETNLSIGADRLGMVNNYDVE